METARRERDDALQKVDIEQLKKFAGPEATECWKVMSVPQRRAVLQTIGLEFVVLQRREKRGPGFEPETVRVTWRMDTAAKMLHE